MSRIAHTTKGGTAPDAGAPVVGSVAVSGDESGSELADEPGSVSAGEPGVVPVLVVGSDTVASDVAVVGEPDCDVSATVAVDAVVPDVLASLEQLAVRT